MVYNQNMRSRISSIYQGMIYRCYNPKSYGYKWYGAKGIKVCDEWKENYCEFYLWAIDNGYQDDLTIDRIDNTKGYCPENCRWVTTEEQHRNMSTTKKIHNKR